MNSGHQNSATSYNEGHDPRIPSHESGRVQTSRSNTHSVEQMPAAEFPSEYGQQSYTTSKNKSSSRNATTSSRQHSHHASRRDEYSTVQDTGISSTSGQYTSIRQEEAGSQFEEPLPFPSSRTVMQLGDNTADPYTSQPSFALPLAQNYSTPESLSTMTASGKSDQRLARSSKPSYDYQGAPATASEIQYQPGSSSKSRRHTSSSDSKHHSSSSKGKKTSRVATEESGRRGEANTTQGQAQSKGSQSTSLDIDWDPVALWDEKAARYYFNGYSTDGKKKKRWLKPHELGPEGLPIPGVDANHRVDAYYRSGQQY